MLRQSLKTVLFFQEEMDPRMFLAGGPCLGVRRGRRGRTNYRWLVVVGFHGGLRG